MRAVVLFSRGVHPLSCCERASPLEIAALDLALGLGCEVIGILAGPAESRLAEVLLGHGLPALKHIELDENVDVEASIAGCLRTLLPELVLAGERSERHTASGALPYRLARSLGYHLICGAVGARMVGKVLSIAQAVPRGGRRLVAVTPPTLVTVSRHAPRSSQFAYRRSRRVHLIERVAGIRSAPLTEGRPVASLRPTRRVERIEGSSAQERIEQLCGSKATRGQVIVTTDAGEAARVIVERLEEWGFVEAANTERRTHLD